MQQHNWLKLAGIIVLTGLASLAQAHKTWGHYTSLSKEQVENFHALDVTGNIEVDFLQSPTLKIHGSGPQKVLDVATAQVKDGVLHIGFLPGKEMPAQLRVVVTGPELTHVTLSGHAEVHVRGHIQTPELVLQLSQNSEFAADGLTADKLRIHAADNSEADLNRLDVKHVHVFASGKADAELAGLALKAELENTGAGEIDASDLRVQTGLATVRGKGNVEISAYETLTAAALGKGKIKYRGAPVNFQQQGNVKHIVADKED